MIVDDEPLARKVLERHLSKLPEWELVDTASNGVEAMIKIKKADIDVIFLDINMPEMNGVELASMLKEKQTPLIVFTTAYSDYAVKGFELAAVDYLVKPIPFDRFYKTIERLEDLLKNQHLIEENDTIIIRADRRDYVVKYSDIFYLEAYGDYIKVHCKNQMLLTKERLSKMVEALPPGLFRQVHRSYVVNTKKIEYYEGHMCHVGGVQIPISSKYRI